MTYLQQFHLGKRLETPRLLRMGKDFDFINNNSFFEMSRKISHGTTPKKYTIDIKIVGHINHCYQQRPLIEIDGWCEFDIATCYLPRMDNGNEELCYILFQPEALCLNSEQGFCISDFENTLGSIFLPENQTRHPELYKQAMKIINFK
jgi:hypothetical protein